MKQKKRMSKVYKQKQYCQEPPPPPPPFPRTYAKNHKAYGYWDLSEYKSINLQGQDRVYTR